MLNEIHPKIKNNWGHTCPLHDHAISQLIRHIAKTMILFFVTFPLFSPTASRELQSGGVRLNDLSEKLLRALEKKDQPQP